MKAKIIVSEKHDGPGQMLTFEERKAELDEQERQQMRIAEEEKKNNNFFMVYRGAGRGAERLIELTQGNHNAASLFLYLSKEMDRQNALVASNKALAEVLKVSEPTMSRAIKYLIEEGFIARFKSGGSSVFVTNPDYVWNAWATGKTSCMFTNSKVLLVKSEQDLTVTKRFNVVMRKIEKEALGESVKPRGRPKLSEEEIQQRALLRLEKSQKAKGQS